MVGLVGLIISAPYRLKRIFALILLVLTIITTSRTCRTIRMPAVKSPILRLPANPLDKRVLCPSAEGHWKFQRSWIIQGRFHPSAVFCPSEHPWQMPSSDLLSSRWNRPDNTARRCWFQGRESSWRGCCRTWAQGSKGAFLLKQSRVQRGLLPEWSWLY